MSDDDFLDDLQSAIPEHGAKRQKLEPRASPALGGLHLPAKNHASPAPTTPVSKPQRSVQNLAVQMNLAAKLQKQQQQQDERQQRVAQVQALGEAMAGASPATLMQVMQAVPHMTEQQQDMAAVALANNPVAYEKFGSMLAEVNGNSAGIKEPQVIEQEPEQVSSDVRQLEQFGAALQQQDEVQALAEQQEQQQPLQLHRRPPQQQQQQQQVDTQNSAAAVDVAEAASAHSVQLPSWQPADHGSYTHLFPDLDVISPDPDEAWRRRCPAGLYFADIKLEDLFIRRAENKNKKKSAAGDGKSSGAEGEQAEAEGLGDDLFVTICSKKQGNRPLRYRTPLMVNGEALLGYGNWKGVQSNINRKYCPSDIKQAKQQVCGKGRGWNGLTVDAHGRSTHVVHFFGWRTAVLTWYAEQCLRLNMALKYVEKDLSDDMMARKSYLLEQVKSNKISKKDAALQIRAWKENSPVGFEELLKMFITKHVTQPVKLRLDKRDNSNAMATAVLVAGVKRKADGSPSSGNSASDGKQARQESKTSSADGDAEDFELDSAISPAAVKTGVPFTEYMIFEKKVLRLPSKMKEGDGQSEYDLLHSKPYKARTPLLQKMWDDHKLIYNDIKFVSLAKGGQIMASSLEVAEQNEATGVRMPAAQFKAKRKLAMNTSSDSKEASSSSNSNGGGATTQSLIAPIPGLSGSLKAGGDYKYANPARMIDWDKASIRAGDVWAFENEVGCFTSSPQKTVGVKDQPMIAFFYRHSRIVVRKMEDDTSIEIPGAEEYTDRTSSMVTDNDMLKALAETEAALQHQQRPGLQQGNRGQPQQQQPGAYQPVLWRSKSYLFVFVYTSRSFVLLINRICRLSSTMANRSPINDRDRLADRLKEQVILHLKDEQPNVQAVKSVSFFEGTDFSVSFIGLTRVNQTNLLRHLRRKFLGYHLTVSTRASDSTYSFEISVRIGALPWFSCKSRTAVWAQRLFCLCWCILIPLGGWEYTRRAGWHAFYIHPVSQWAMVEAMLGFVTGYALLGMLDRR